MAVASPSAFHLLAKPTGAVCNLDCSYCFFLSKEMLYPGSRFRMADDLLATYLRQLIEAHAGRPEVMVAWQGGEPTLMGLDFFRRSVELTNEFLSPGQRAVITIQTNGTLLDAEWCEFFKENDVLVGISIDGPREIHDAYRVNKGGKGSFDEVDARPRPPAGGRGGLERARRRCMRSTLTTAERSIASYGTNARRGSSSSSRSSSARPRRPRTVRRGHRGATGPLYVQEGSYVTNRTVTAKQYGRFLIDVFEEWVRRDVGEVYVQMFDVALANWVGEPPGLCVHSETCGAALALEHTGDLYSCDHFVEPRFRLGNIKEEHMLKLVSSQQQVQFGFDKRDHAAAVLPRLRRSVRLPRRLSEGPLHRDAVR